MSTKEIAMDGIFDYEHPFVCTDAIVFAICSEETSNYRKLPELNLNVLLYKRTTEPYRDKWCLPGGFIDIDELPEDNIRRKIFEKSYVENCFLEQLHAFCDIDRDPRARVISIAYMGLMREEEAKKFKDRSTWFTIQFQNNRSVVFLHEGDMLTGEDIGFDHYAVIQKALKQLQSKILHEGIIFELMPAEFTLTQLQNVYETIVGKKEMAANFRRKISNMVVETDNYTSDKGHRPAKLFVRKMNKIQEVEK